MDDDLKHLLEAMREESATAREENATAHQETRRHFDVALERIETRFDSSPRRSSTSTRNYSARA